jgi:hypothetical protein
MADMRRLPLLFVAVLYPILLNAATFGPEVPVAPPDYSSAYGYQTASSVACDGQSCVSLWVDYDYARTGIYSSVIDANGNVQPAASNRLISGYVGGASIVWTGDHYLATWTNVDAKTVVAAPLSRDGRISGAIQTIASTFYSPLPTLGGLAWDGRYAFTVFQDSENAGAAILDANGVVVRKIALPTHGVMTASVAAAGQTFAIVWTEDFQSTTTIKFQRYAENGSLLDDEPITLAQGLPVDFTRAGIAGNGSQFGVAYTPAVDNTLHRLRIDASTGAMETLPVISFTRQLSGVYWSGDDFVAYAADINTIDTERFSFDALRVLHVSPIGVADATLVPGPTGSIAVWTDLRGGNYTHHVYGSLLDKEATAIEKGDFPVSLSVLPQTRPALATSGSGALLAWNRLYDSAVSDIVVQRLDSAGRPIDATPTVLATHVQTIAPTTVWLGNAYLVVWIEFNPGNRILGKRVSANGAVLDANPIVFGDGYRAVLTSNGTLSVLAFARSEGLALLRLNADGTAMDSKPITITSQTGDALAAGSNGNEFVIAWAEYDGSPSGPLPGLRDIYAVRLTANGQPIDAAPIVIATSARDERDPAIASDGRDFLIAYSDDKIATKRLLANGALAGSTAEDEGVIVDDNGVTPAIAWMGGQYVIAWGVPADDGSTVASTTLDANGTPLDVARALGRSDLHVTVQVAVVPIQGAAVIAYSRGNAADVGIPRVFTRQVVSASPRGRGIHH